MICTRILRAAAIAVCAAGALAAQDKVYTEFDPAVDFTRFKTFSFVPAANMAMSGTMKDPATRERIRNFIEGGLEGRGLTEVPRDQKHDLAIRFWAAVQNKQSVEVNLSADPYWTDWGGFPPYWTGAWGYSYQEYVVKNYREGTLVVDLIDPVSKELVWRTVFKQDLTDRVKAHAALQKNLAKSLSQLPPSAKDKEKMEDKRRKLKTKYM
jgi:hypothetical protein